MRYVSFGRHPTQWAWNGAEAIHLAEELKLLLSPSHTVGSEQKRKLCFYFFMLRNSRHPTQWAWNKKLYTFVSYFLDFRMSPSHPMGLKPLPKSLKIQALTLSKFKQPTERTH